MYALVMQDEATMWLYVYPNAAKDAVSVKRAFGYATGSENVDTFY